MQFEETELAGAYVLTLKPIEDDRGFFMRSFCKKELEKNNLYSEFVQCNISYNKYKGTLRGLHYQEYPHEEIKIVYCRKGSFFDVIVDIRKNSSTYGQWFGIELSEKNHQALYVPKGFAHGFQTLENDVEVSYFMGNYYHPEAAKGILWNDPTLGIKWPKKDERLLSDRDKNFPRWIT